MDETASPDAPRMVWIDPLGNVMICPGLSIGSLHESSLQDILDRYDPDGDPILRALNRNGPQGLYALARDRGIIPDGPFLDRCDLCFKSRQALRDIYSRTLTPEACYPTSTPS